MFDTVDYSKQVLKTIDSKVIKFLEKRIKKNIPTVLWFENTTGLTSEMLKNVPNSDLVKICVLGGLNKEKYYNEHYYERNTYSAFELSCILRNMELLETGVNPNWDPLEKAKYIFSKLAHYIEYDFDKNREGKYCSSLRALVDRKAICAGYSLIFKELMDRQGIPCDYVRGRTKEGKHAWNIITIDGVDYAVDVTNESGLIHQKRDFKENYQFFGFTNKIVNYYNPDEDERINDYSKYLNQEKPVAKTVKYPDYKLCNRDDGTSFIIKDVTKQAVSGIHEYLQCEVNSDGTLGKSVLIMSENDLEVMMQNQESLKYFVNSLLAKNRIERYTSQGNGYIGYLDQSNKKLYNEVYGRLNIETKTYTRDDNSTIILKKVPQSLENKKIYKYITYELVPDGNYLDIEVNSVYSEHNISNPQTQEYDYMVANYLLDRDRIKDKSMYSAGYLGTIILNNGILEKTLYKDSYQEVLEEVVKLS